MYRKILVPLDGSELAECVLPHVKAIGSGCDVGEAVLMEVIEPIPTRAEDGGDRINALQDASESVAREYLAEQQTKLASGGLKVSSEVVWGKPADTIIDFAENNGVDLVMIATHGRSGVSRWVFGSVAEKVLRSSHVPLLLVRSPGCEPGI
ncbi:MAG: universal stress protein [Chloroflexota bacterium]|nr:universal stress protein [Chloroflexota bacterium]